MLDNKEIYEQSMVDHLYYSRTSRSFCITIGLSFYGNNRKYIDEAIVLGTRASDISNQAVSYTGRKVGEKIVNSGFYYTPYTIRSEKLTEKLFNIENELKSNLESDIKSLKNKNDISLNTTFMKNIENLNEEGLELAQDFCNFCINIRSELAKNNLFSYLYPDFFNYMYDAVNIYVEDLERIIKKQNYAPIYIQNYEYYFSEILKKSAQYIRGFLDTRHQDVFDMATFYVNAFKGQIDKYLKVENKEVLSKETENLVINYRDFISNCLEKILKKDLYFITPMVTIDHFLAATNVYLYIVNYIKENPNTSKYLL